MKPYKRENINTIDILNKDDKEYDYFDYQYYDEYHGMGNNSIIDYRYVDRSKKWPFNIKLKSSVTTWKGVLSKLYYYKKSEYLPRQSEIDMESIYTKEELRQRKIEKILGDVKDTSNTIGNIISHKLNS